MRKITVRVNERDYLDFLLESNEYGNTAEEQVNEIIQYYIMIRRRRPKLNVQISETLDEHV